MWLENIKELKKMKGMSVKQIAEKTHLPERTVSRIFSGDTDSPYVDTLHRIVKALGGSLDDILADTKVKVSGEDLSALRISVDALTIERDELKNENTILKERSRERDIRICELISEVEKLKLQIEHKDEIIALHNYYNKLKTNK